MEQFISNIWDHFTKLPENEDRNIIAACNYCGKKYLCGTNCHIISNLVNHSKLCYEFLHAILNHPNQDVNEVEDVQLF